MRLQMKTQTTNPIEIGPGAWLLKGALGNAVITRVAAFGAKSREAYVAVANNLWSVQRESLTAAVEWAAAELEA